MKEYKKHNNLNQIASELRGKFKDGTIKTYHTFPAWAEYKHDGEYVVVFISNGNAKIANRHKTTYNPSSQIDEALPKKDCVLECEYISLRGGLYKFLSDRAKPDGPNVALRVFNILFWDGEHLRNKSYEERMRVLDRVISKTKHVQVVERRKIHNTNELEQFYHEALCSGVEGLVMKHNGKYVKIKPKISKDVVILGIGKTKSWIENKIPFSFFLGLKDKNGKWQMVGKSSSGLTLEKKVELAKVLMKNKISEDKKRIIVKPTEVLEIVYQNREKNGFRHPRIVRWRDDKSPDQCEPFELDCGDKND